MQATFIIAVMVFSIVLLLLLGAPIRPARFLAQSLVKLGIGILFLFFFNVFGGSIGLHIPINLFTVFISGFLGITGLFSLLAMTIFL